MLMDVCHILLGRPWEYDRKEIHNGRRNTDTFGKDAEKNVLLPFENENPTEEEKSKVMLLSGKEFLQEIKHEEINFDLICKT